MVIGRPNIVFPSPSGTTVTVPQQRDFCDVQAPFQAQVKLNGAFGLPYGFRTGITYQNLPGIPIYATFVARNADIAPSLGRNLSSGANGTAIIDLIAPLSRFEDRITQLDVRFSRAVRIARPEDRGAVRYRTTRSTRVRFCRSTRGTGRRG